MLIYKLKFGREPRHRDDRGKEKAILAGNGLCYLESIWATADTREISFSSLFSWLAAT